MKALGKILLMSCLSIGSVLGKPNNDFWSQFEVVNDNPVKQEYKNNNDWFSQFGGYEIKNETEMAKFKEEHEVIGVIYRDFPDGRKKVPIKIWRKKNKTKTNPYDLSKYGLIPVNNAQDDFAAEKSQATKPGVFEGLNGIPVNQNSSKNNWNDLGFVPSKNQSNDDLTAGALSVGGEVIQEGKKPIRRWTPPRDYLFEIKESLNNIFDSCLIICGIALMFIILKMFYSIVNCINAFSMRLRQTSQKDNRVIEEKRS